MCGRERARERSNRVQKQRRASQRERVAKMEEQRERNGEAGWTRGSKLGGKETENDRASESG